MAENDKDQGKKSWIPPAPATVPYGPVLKTHLSPINQMRSRELSNQHPQPRFVKKSRPMEDMEPQSSLSDSPPRSRYVKKSRPMEDMEPQSSLSDTSLRRRRIDTKPMSMEEMLSRSERPLGSFLHQDSVEPMSMEDMLRRSRRPRSPSPPGQIVKKSRYDMQPQSERSLSSRRPPIVMKSKFINNIPTPGEIPKFPKLSLMSFKACPTTSTDNYFTKRKSGRQTFHKFSDLPLELQIMIWQWYGRTHANSNPNVIKIFRCFRPALQNFTEREDPTERNSYFAISYKLPPIFYVCKLTFKIAKELYETEFQVIPMIKDDKKLTYFNEDRDIIALEDAQVLRDWRYNRQTESEFAGMTQMNLSQPAAEKITRRINIKHLVIGGTNRSHLEARQLGRFYDCESIMLGVPYLIRNRFFSTEDGSQPDRESISFLRDRLLRFWKEERRGPFVREDYRRKPIRPVVAEPSWDTSERTISNPMFFVCTDDEITYQLHRLHPAITNFMTPVQGDGISITFMNDMKFSRKHARLFDNPWECVPKKKS